MFSHTRLCLFVSAAVLTVCNAVKFPSKPTLNPVEFVVTQQPSSKAYQPGYYFTCPSSTDGTVQNAPVIYTSSGQVVWSAPELGPCSDLRTQQLHGNEVLTLWASQTLKAGYGSGRALVLNSTYDVIYNITTSSPLGADLHEFTIPTVSAPNAPSGSTALITSYLSLPANLSIVGGTGKDTVLESYFEEVDLVTGKVLFAWNASSHVDYTQSFMAYSGSNNAPATGAWDFFHINSIDKDSNGDYLVSSRHYHQLYKVNGSTGHVEWTLGGKQSSWSLDNNTQFSWQHDARWVTEGSVISLFDDASDGMVKDETASRGLFLRLHEGNMSVAFEQQYKLPTGNISTSQGSVRIDSQGNVLVGWGSNPSITEHLNNGSLMYAARLGAVGSSVNNYRALKSTTYKAYPQTLPDVAIDNNTVYVSWNGATEVASWALHTGNSMHLLAQSTIKNRTAFEETFDLPAGQRAAFVQLVGLDAQGRVLGKSSVLAANGTVVEGGLVVPAPGPHVTGPGVLNAIMTPAWAPAVGNDTKDVNGA